MTPTPERPTKPVSLADELDDVVARVQRADGTEADPVEVWQLVIQFALLRLREAEERGSNERKKER